jgi:EAL domain-containing protein (putative c-di-GMP-specific phosphodiesterase class I)
MNDNIYAVIIGFNKFEDKTYLPELEFAEKDAHDLYEALIDPDCGNIPEKNIRLITGQVSRDEIETALYVHAVIEREKEDTVLIYYSGHGFIAGDTPESYLALPDTYVMKINKNPNAGLQMEYLREKIFLAKSKKRPKNVVFLLDCCYSGAFCPEIKGGTDQRPKALVEAQDFDSDGRVAFVSSPSGVVSREDKILKNGIFTKYLLLGLRGEAVEKNTGEVTVSSLVSYVQSMSPSTQPPIFYGKSHRIALARPKVEISTLLSEQALIQERRILKNLTPFTKEPQILPLRNPIEQHLDCIDNLVVELTKLEREPGEKTALGNQILNGIRDSLNAEFVLVEQLKTTNDLRHKFWSDLPSASTSLRDYAGEILSHVYPVLIEEKSKLLPSRFGFRFENEGTKEGNNYSIVIPLRLEYPREYLIISGIKDTILEYGEILGHALLSLYKATLEFSTLDIRKVENFLLDEMKHNFGQVPYSVYAKRFAKFKEHLYQIVFFYEPVIALGKKTIEIDSWEALARDLETKMAPRDLFDAAQLWGPEFITELDLYCLRTATKDFSEKWKMERKNEKMDALAVNVYPETLFRTNYIKELHRIIDEEELIKGKRLVLEISEKHPISWIDRMESKFTDNPIDAFANHIQNISKSLGISFAIDDFGVGHSSTERLAKLELDHVKIDRDVLYHPHPQYTIKYVMDIVQSSHKHPIKVVMEGFDGGSEISLSELHNDLKILYVQGHLIRKASPTVADLDEETKKDIIERISLRN